MFSTGRLEEAAAACARALRAQPRHPEALHLLGLIRWQQGDGSGAADALRQALAANADASDVCNNLAAVLGQLGKTDEAIEVLRRALALAPDSADLYVNLGNALSDRGDVDEAGDAYQHALRLSPQHVPAWRNLGRLFRGLGQLDEAIAAFDRALALQPDDTRALNMLGSTLLEKGDHRQALRMFEQGAALKPTDASVHYNMGLAQAKGGAVEAALASYRRAIACDAQHEKARESLGRLLHMTGRVAEAIESYRQWLALEPKNATAAHMLAASTGQDVPQRAADAYVAGLFNRYAEQFDQSLHRLHYRAPQLLLEAMERHGLKPDPALQVLDAGCGTGLCGPLLRAYASRLTGVDLSPGMLAQARRRGGYDQLIEAELTAFLQAHPDAWDLIASADTFNYFGELAPLLTAAARALRPGGVIVFTLEHGHAGDAAQAIAAEDAPSGEHSDATRDGGRAALAAKPYQLKSHGRYSHDPAHVRALLPKVGLSMTQCELHTLRVEADQHVTGMVIVAQHAGTASAP